MLNQIFSKKFLVHVVLALIVVIIAVGAAYYYLKSYTHQDAIVTVPSLEGYDVVEAEAVLKEMTLEGLVVDSLYLPQKRGGTIVDQEPKAESKIKEHRKIYLTIARYTAPMVKLPNVVDQTLALALAKLNSYGIEVGEIINRPSECTGCVVGVQVKGKKVIPGTALNKGQKVDLMVGEGDTGASIPIPMLYGLSVEEAQLLVNRQGLNLGATIYLECENAADSAAARVFRQSPEPQPGAQITTGSSIDAYLSPNLDQIPPVNVDSIKAQLR